MNLFGLVKESIKILLFCFVVSFLPVYPGAGGPSPALPEISQEEFNKMSPDEKKEFEAKFKAQIEAMSPQQQQAYMEQAVEEMFQSLPPEQQKEVLAEVEKIENMTKDEQQDYFKKVEKELEQTFGKPPAKPAESPIKPIEKSVTPAKEPKKTKKPLTIAISKEDKARKEAVNLINEIVGHISDFLIKMEANEEYIISKTASWGTKKKIEAWDGGFDWGKLKIKIESLQSKLEKLKDRDEKTKKYKYLDFLIEDKELYTKIYNLSVDLVDYEPSIKAQKKKRSKSKLEMKVRRTSNKSIRKLLSAFAKILFPQTKKEEDVLTSLDKLFKKYEKTEKKITSEEKKKEETAIQASKRKGRQTSSRVIGKSSESGYSSPGYESPYESSDDYDYGSYDQYEPSYRHQPKSSGESSPTTSGAKKGDSTPKKEAKPTGKAKEKDDAELRKDSHLDKLTKRIDTILDAVSNIFDDYEELHDLEKYLKEAKLNKELAQHGIPNLQKQLKRAISTIIQIQKKLNDKKLSKASIDSYARNIKNTIEVTAGNIKNLAISLESVSKPIGDDEQKWAHYGVEIITDEEEPKKIMKRIPKPVTFEDLQKAAVEFLEFAHKTVGL